MPARKKPFQLARGVAYLYAERIPPRSQHARRPLCQRGQRQVSFLMEFRQPGIHVRWLEGEALCKLTVVAEDLERRRIRRIFAAAAFAECHGLRRDRVCDVRGASTRLSGSGRDCCLGGTSSFARTARIGVRRGGGTIPLDPVPQIIG